MSNEEEEEEEVGEEAVGAIAEALEEQLTLKESLVAKGKPSSRAQGLRGGGCSSSTRRKLADAILRRRPVDLQLDPDTLNTPIHRVLEASNRAPTLQEVAEELQKLLTELRDMRYLQTYVNLPNVNGRTPLSLCMKSASLGPLVGTLVQHGAQLHHLCGDVADRYNHLHYAMHRAPPDTIHRTLDALFEVGQYGADGMYSLNHLGETPKDVLLRRLQQCDSRQLQQQLRSVLLRIPAYPPLCDTAFDSVGGSDSAASL